MSHFIAIHLWAATGIAGFLLVLLAVFVMCLLRAAGSHDVPVAQDEAEGANAEEDIQERSNALVWLALHGLACWSAVSFWVRFKRVCSWHQPRAIRMAGNPWARKSTHGMCPECFARVSGEIAAHEPEFKSRAA